MKSGSPCFGTPENALALYAGAQMARHYNLPYRSGGNFTASRIPDAQAGYESSGTMWPTVQAGVNFVLHAAGWLEGGLIAGYEKFILDLEICGMMARLVEGIGLTDEEKIRPGGFESLCNPIGQAKLLNEAGTGLNVVVGLCVGHDSLFFQHSEAPVTVLVAKDRVTGHNPAAALYTSHSYYRRLREKK